MIIYSGISFCQQIDKNSTFNRTTQRSTDTTEKNIIKIIFDFSNIKHKLLHLSINVVITYGHTLLNYL